MADVLLCYARDDAAAAGRLAAAVTQRGYKLWSEADLAGADIADRISGTKAAIVLWSEAAAASDWVRAEANFARGQNKLIQASVDAVPPPLPFRPDDVVSLAGWQGEGNHPGWRRIAAALEALCGPPSAEAAPARPTAAPTPVGERRRGSRFTLIFALTIVLLAAVALATFLSMRDLTPRSAEPKPPPAATARPALPTAAPPPLPAAVPEPVPAEPALEADEPRTAAQAAPRPAGPRIIRENAENMRLFCERAGRGTPECRTFARRLRSQRR